MFYNIDTGDHPFLLPAITGDGPGGKGGGVFFFYIAESGEDRQQAVPGGSLFFRALPGGLLFIFLESGCVAPTGTGLFFLCVDPAGVESVTIHYCVSFAL